MTDHAELTPKERDLIRRAFMRRLTAARSIHDGIMLKRWSTGPRKGEPKLQAAVQSLLDRGLVELADLDRHWPTARFTALAKHFERTAEAGDEAQDWQSRGATGFLAPCGSVPTRSRGPRTGRPRRNGNEMPPSSGRAALPSGNFRRIGEKAAVP